MILQVQAEKIKKLELELESVKSTQHEDAEAVNGNLKDVTKKLDTVESRLIALSDYVYKNVRSG
jgi:hypothetical protein